MYTFLYCFDNKYNSQAFTSIISLLNNVSKNIKINVLHTDMEDEIFIPKKILSHNKLESINVFKFNNSNLKFPNISGNHVSEATYYRLYFEKYISLEIEKIVYVDSDIVFLKCPLNELESIMNELNNSDYVLSAKTEEEMFTNNLQKSKDLKISSLRYFNAGMMVIDIKKWRNNDVENKLIRLQTELSELIEFWDQDVLNAYFDGEYIELPDSHNVFIDLALEQNSKITAITNDTISIHYIGKTKPWSVKGILLKDSFHFQNAYRLFSNSDFFITHSVRKRSLLILIKSIFNLKIFNVDKPFSFFFSSLRSMI